MGHCTVAFFGFLLQLKNRLCQRELNGKNCLRHGGRNNLMTILQYSVLAAPGVRRRQHEFCRHILNTNGFMHENFGALASVAVTLTS